MNKTPYKILYIQGTDRLGGSHTSVLDQACGLDKEKFKPILLCNSKNNLYQLAKKSNLDVHIVSMGMWRKFKSWPKALLSLWKIKNLLRQEKIDLIHCNTLWDNPYGVIPARKIGIPVVTHLRNLLAEDKVRKYLLERADLILSMSNAICDSLKNYPDLLKKCQTLYHGVDLTKFSPHPKDPDLLAEFHISDSEFIFGIVARLDEQKGFRTILQILKNLNGKMQNWRFLWVGKPAPWKEYLIQEGREFIKQNNLEDKVCFCGYREDIPRLLNLFDVTMMPSEGEEGFGIANIEAMAMGIPVIASNLGGIPEIITHGETGLIVAPQDVSGFVSALIKLNKDVKLRSKMGKNAYQCVYNKFNLKNYLAALQEIYLGLIEKYSNKIPS